MFHTPAGYLIENVANSATFQTWTGAEDATEAKAFIHKIEMDPASTKPRALITPGPDRTAERTGFGPKDVYRHTGELRLWFEKAKVKANPLRTEVGAFLIAVDVIFDEILDLSGTAGRLSIQRMEIAEEPAVSGEENEIEIISVCYSVHWG